MGSPGGAIPLWPERVVALERGAAGPDGTIARPAADDMEVSPHPMLEALLPGMPETPAVEARSIRGLRS